MTNSAPARKSFVLSFSLSTFIEADTPKRSLSSFRRFGFPWVEGITPLGMYVNLPAYSKEGICQSSLNVFVAVFTELPVPLNIPTS